MTATPHRLKTLASFLTIGAVALTIPAQAIDTLDDHPAAIMVDFNATVGPNQQQEGWTEQLVANASLKTIEVSTTDLGTSLGIGASLVDDGETWESRRGGNVDNRWTVIGTSVDNLFDGFLVTRDQGATLNLSGLAVGQDYRLLIPTNDNHDPGFNPGFATPLGSTLTLSVNSGATTGASAVGQITNNSGADGATSTDDDFTLASLSFTATTAAVSIDLESSNTTNGFLPINGLVLQVVAPPIDFRITYIERHADGSIDLTWNSDPATGTNYAVLYNQNLTDLVETWADANDTVATQGTSTSYTVSAEDIPANAPELFFKIRLNAPSAPPG